MPDPFPVAGTLSWSSGGPGFLSIIRRQRDKHCLDGRLPDECEIRSLRWLREHRLL